MCRVAPVHDFSRGGRRKGRALSVVWRDKLICEAASRPHHTDRHVAFRHRNRIFLVRISARSVAES